MNPIVARYLSVPGVHDWLMCRKPVQNVTLAALDNSFVYSIGLGLTKSIRFRPAQEEMDPPDGNEIEDLLIVTDMCGDFVLGTIYGLSFEHMFSATPLMQEAKVVCRRFAVDLSRRTELEFLEFVWFEDGKLITMDRTFFHTETGELPTRAEAILYDVVPHNSFPETVLMRASVLELPDCRFCSSMNRPCKCPLSESILNGDARQKEQAATSRQVVTTCWGNYAANFMSKARNGRVSLKYFQNFPGIGEVQLEHRSLSIVNILVNGHNPYIQMARRRAIHHLGLQITPRFEERFTIPSMLSDFQNLHMAYTEGLREFTGDDTVLPLPPLSAKELALNGLASPLAKKDIFDPVYIEELFDSASSGNNESHQLANSTDSTTLAPVSQLASQTTNEEDSVSEVYSTLLPEQMQVDVPQIQSFSGSAMQGALTGPEISYTEVSAASSGLKARSGSYTSSESYRPHGISKRSRAVRKPATRALQNGNENGTHQQQRLRCPQCPSSFKTKGDLRRHKLTIHDKIKPFVCDKCNATFGHRGHLNRHVKTVHLRERPHRCGTCGFRFLQASHLKMHDAMVHQKLKNFQCHICKLSVTTRSALRNHLRHVHDIADIYQCPVQGCLEGFVLEYDRDRHLTKVHHFEKGVA